MSFEISPQKPIPAIAIAAEAPYAIRHAGEELRAYTKTLTGVDLPIVPESRAHQRAKNGIILIGTPDYSLLIREMVSAGYLPRAEKESGDRFLARSLRYDGRDYLVLCGFNDRSVIYAVYHYLEKHCGVGFFWDGEYVPRVGSIRIRDTSIDENARFSLRGYGQMCALVYSAKYWDFSDWRRELDWMMKRRLNLLCAFPGLHCYWNYPPFGTVWKRAMRRLGVSLEEPTEWELFQEDLGKQICDYAGKLGIDVIAAIPDGRVNVEFKRKYASCRYISIQWADLNSYLDYLHPADPMYLRVISAFLGEYEKTFGASRVYGYSMYGECEPGDTREEQVQFKKDFAHAIRAVVKMLPKGSLVTINSWAFEMEKYWDEKDAKMFLDLLPQDSIVVDDLWAEKNPKYVKHHYFHGKKWTFSVLHAMAGWLTLHGDIRKLMERARGLLDDPKAINCCGFSFMPEILHHNAMYARVITEAAWNPESLELDGYLEAYARLRYGNTHGGKMLPCLRELTQSVYAGDNVSPPLYQVIPDPISGKPRSILGTEALRDHRAIEPDERERFIPHLHRAMELAFAVCGDMKENDLYIRDVIDILRQYLADLSTRLIQQLYEAYKELKRNKLDCLAGNILTVLDVQENLLKTHPYFVMKTEVGKAQLRPRFSPNWTNVQDICRRYSIWDDPQQYAGLMDYCRRDLYELLKFYYRKRVEAYISFARRAMDDPEVLDSGDLEAAYARILEKWLKAGFVDKGEDLPRGNPLQAALKGWEKVKMLC
jgi:alpha-N-acetylglucosaminidase